MGIIKRHKSTVYGLETELSALQLADSTESSTRASADADLLSSITSEETARIAADVAIQAGLDAEVAARVAADGDLSTLSTTSKGSLVSAINEVLSVASSSTGDLQTQLNTEITNRTADVDAEEARAIAAEATLLANITSVTTAYLAADSALDARLDTIESGLVSGAMWKGSVATIGDLDLLVEANMVSGWAYYVTGTNDAYVVLPEADGDYKPASWTTKSFLKIADYTEVSGLVTAESTRAIAVEADLQAQVTAEVTRATAVEGALSNLTTTNQTSLVAAINEVSFDLGETDNYVQDVETALTASISNEVTRATSAETTLQNNINVVTASVAALDADTYSIAETDEAIRRGGAIFVTETKVVTADKITLSYEPKNGMILNFATVRHTDANYVSYDIPVLVTATAGGKEFQLYPNIAGEFDTKNVMVQYAYIPVPVN